MEPAAQFSLCGGLFLRYFRHVEPVLLAFEENGVSVTDIITSSSASLSQLTINDGGQPMLYGVPALPSIRHADGLVVWEADMIGESGHVGRELMAYDTAIHCAAVVDTEQSDAKAFWAVSGINNGWLVWSTSNPSDQPAGDLHLTSYAVRTLDINAAFKALGDV